MSTTAAEVFDRSAYEAPEANLVGGTEQTENKLYSAEGRIGIWQYNALFAKVIFVAVLCFAAMYGAYSTGSEIVMAVVGVPLFVVVLAGVVALIYAAIKRLHDLGHSGWFYLIGMIPIVGVIFTLYYALKPGKEEDNDYGAPRTPAPSDKLFGIIGMVLLVGMNIVSLLPMGG